MRMVFCITLYLSDSKVIRCEIPQDRVCSNCSDIFDVRIVTDGENNHSSGGPVLCRFEPYLVPQESNEICLQGPRKGTL